MELLVKNEVMEQTTMELFLKTLNNLMTKKVEDGQYLEIIVKLNGVVTFIPLHNKECFGRILLSNDEKVNTWDDINSLLNYEDVNLLGHLIISPSVSDGCLYDLEFNIENDFTKEQPFYDSEYVWIHFCHIMK